MDLDLSGVSFSIIDIFQSGIHGQGHHSVTGITSFPDLVSTAEATTDSRQPSVLPSPTSSSSATLIGTSPPSALPPVNFTYVSPLPASSSSPRTYYSSSYPSSSSPCMRLPHEYFPNTPPSTRPQLQPLHHSQANQPDNDFGASPAQPSSSLKVDSPEGIERQQQQQHQSSPSPDVPATPSTSSLFLRRQSLHSAPGISDTRSSTTSTTSAPHGNRDIPTASSATAAAADDDMGDPSSHIPQRRKQTQAPPPGHASTFRRGSLQTLFLPLSPPSRSSVVEKDRVLVD